MIGPPPPIPPVDVKVCRRCFNDHCNNDHDGAVTRVLGKEFTLSSFMAESEKIRQKLTGVDATLLEMNAKTDRRAHELESWQEWYDGLDWSCPYCCGGDDNDDDDDDEDDDDSQDPSEEDAHPPTIDPATGRRVRFGGDRPAPRQ